jgi:nucleotide-binding universal stress UspA family protein
VEELPRYRRILLATDGSDTAAAAARHGVALARQAGAALTVVYAIDSHLAFRLGIHRDEAIREMREDGARALEATAALARAAGVEVDLELCEGRPGEAIVDQVERSGSDLIVLGSHGQGALADVFLGSVSQYVLHHAHVPVCIVRPPR